MCSVGSFYAVEGRLTPADSKTLEVMKRAEEQGFWSPSVSVTTIDQLEDAYGDFFDADEFGHLLSYCYDGVLPPIHNPLRGELEYRDEILKRFPNLKHEE